MAYLAGTPAAQELAFTRQQIDVNFSNYSAWHYRSTLLRRAAASGDGGESPAASTASAPDLAARRAGPLFAPADAAQGEACAPLSCEALELEFELVTQAFFTEPDDQAGWFYHQWLVGEALAGAACEPPALSWAEARRLLSRQKDVCTELAAMEPACRWPLVTQLDLLRALARCDAQQGAGRDGEWQQEARHMLHTLLRIDPLRTGYYTDCLAELEDDARAPE